MSSFASWGLTILGLAVVMTIAEMLLPSGKLKRVIRSVFATITALCIITPIPTLLKSLGAKIDGITFDKDIDITDSEYLDYIDGRKKSIIERGAIEYLATKGIEGVNIEVELDSSGYGVKCARVDFSKFPNIGITQDGEHINKSEIILLIAEYFGVGKEAIMTYG
ncbi:MAG: hypothetical protein J1G04_00580 [Clostridiales bacterium]|nr:hypothetical protein [Clostridiales bacterium]